MTLIVGAIDTRTGAVHLAGDTKVTWDNNPTNSRKIYKHPALKIIRLSDDLAVGYAGAGPDTLAREIAKLSGIGSEAVLAGLQAIGGATFIVAARSPARLWMVRDGEWAEMTNQGLVIAGDDEEFDESTVFDVVRSRYDDRPDDDAGSRLMSTMQHVIQLVRPSSIGGLLVMISASEERGFHYEATPSTNFEAIYPGEVVERPMRLHTLPGTGETPGAVAFWIENAGVGHLFRDGEPDVRREMKVATAEQFAAQARESFGQSLLVPTEDALTAFLRQIVG